MLHSTREACPSVLDLMVLDGSLEQCLVVSWGADCDIFFWNFDLSALKKKGKQGKAILTPSSSTSWTAPPCPGTSRTVNADLSPNSRIRVVGAIVLTRKIGETHSGSVGSVTSIEDVHNSQCKVFDCRIGVSSADGTTLIKYKGKVCHCITKRLRACDSSNDLVVSCVIGWVGGRVVSRGDVRGDMPLCSSGRRWNNAPSHKAKWVSRGGGERNLVDSVWLRGTLESNASRSARVDGCPVRSRTGSKCIVSSSSR